MNVSINKREESFYITATKEDGSVENKGFKNLTEVIEYLKGLFPDEAPAEPEKKEETTETKPEETKK